MVNDVSTATAFVQTRFLLNKDDYNWYFIREKERKRAVMK